MPAPEADVAALYEKLNPDVRPLMEALRGLFAEVTAEATERVNMGWRVIQYSGTSSMRDMVAALSPQRAYVNLEFADGVELTDPAHKLEGTGKRLRHVKVRKPEDAQDPAVRTLLEEAARKRGM